MATYVFTKSITATTPASAPLLSPTQKVAEKYIVGFELYVDTGTPAGLPVGVQVKQGSMIIWPSEGGNEAWVRAPVGLKIFHKCAIENTDPKNITVAWTNSDAAAHYAEVNVIAENHADGILCLAILQVLKGLVTKLDVLLTPPGVKNGKATRES